jgi:soluble lytic murein transglycosylase-like protein
VRHALAGLAAALLLILAGAAPHAARAAGAGLDLHVLSDADAAVYRDIATAQERGDWKTADRLIAKLDDDLLMGHVLFQRYMHPTAYTSSFRELADWLEDYADLPGAERIYKLALRRMPKGAKAPRTPVEVAADRLRYPPRTIEQLPMRNQSGPRMNRALKLRDKALALVAQGNPTKAVGLIDNAEGRGLLSSEEFAYLAERIARAYLRYDKDALAEKWGTRASAEPSWAPLGNWTAGLAAWRLSRYGDALAQFRHMIDNPQLSGWNRAAGAYWAARAAQIAGRPDEHTRLLQKAAVYDDTFYGLVAHAALGTRPKFDFTLPAPSQEEIARIAASGPGKRALALVQTGRQDLAEQELRRLLPDPDDPLDPALRQALLDLGAAADLPHITFTMGKLLDADAPGRAGALYPLPPYAPEGGFRLDRALLYAFMRQESAFYPAAVSYAGARGLMQLMPSTATYVADKRYTNGRQNLLFEAELNLSLGQDYLEYLLANDAVQGDLFKLTAAYNGGPGNLRKWLRETNFKNDPLLFIETLPAVETRIFIERVLTNYWIYRMRLGQPTPSLKEVAADKWPRYHPQETGGGSTN